MKLALVFLLAIIGATILLTIGVLLISTIVNNKREAAYWARLNQIRTENLKRNKHQ